MDPLSTLGLAGNVIQFVDFGIKLVSSFNQICRSPNGALQKHTELSEIVTRLKITSDQLAQSTYDSDTELRQIALGCRDASNELLELLAGLQNRANQHRKLNTVRITLKSVMKEGAIRDLDSKLQRLQQQLNTSLLALLHGSDALLTKKISEIIDANQRFHLETTVSLERLIHELERFNMLGQSVITLPEIGQQIDALTEESKLAGKRQRILKSLRYNIMYDRFEDVVNAYDRTFKWMLNDPALGFSGWLKSPTERTFWITGKPGSGKSTLMKYVHQQPGTRNLLREWAGSQHLVIANHFFWVSGDPLQRRQIGLLRSLLFQILLQCPQLIASVCETRWNEDELTGDEPWNQSTLSSCFERLANNEALDAKICLFIDGLDEYDGDHRELIRLLRDLVRSSKSQLFKLCLSSRPWNVFEAEYGELQNKLCVHDLTSEDILLYVDRHLRGDQYLNEIFTDEQHQSSELTQMITKKAQGVFLWVHYVVRLLLKTAVDCPTMSDLWRIVDGYPDELDPLFERILATIPKVYHRGTAQTIRICLESISPPPLVVLRIAEKGIENENYALRKEIVEPTKDDIKDLHRFKKRLKGRCMDFIEVHTSKPTRPISIPSVLNSQVPWVYNYQVDFFHRTVRDFLQMKKGWMNEWAGETFDVHLTICSAILVLFKTLPSSTLEWEVNHDLIARSLTQFFASANNLETERGMPIRTLLEQLDDVFRAWSTKAEGFHWSDVIHKVFHQSDQPAHPTFNMDLCYIAVQVGLLLYVREKIKPNLARRSGPILHHALVGDRPLVGFFTLNQDVIRHLIDCGADPNERYGGQSAWCEFLVRCLEKEALHHQCLDSASVETIELLLQYGANPDDVCDMRSLKELGQIDGEPTVSMNVEEILRRVHPDKSRLLTLLAEARERRLRLQLDTGTALPTLDPQRGLLEVQSDILRSDCVGTPSGCVEIQGDRAETRGEKPEPEKRKRGWRLWAFLNRIFA